jgi:hypothetical protein
MDKDPVFAQNPDLPEVSNQHTADATPICEGSSEATKVKLSFKDGFSLTVPVTQQMKSNCGFGFNRAVGVGDGKGEVVTAGGQPLAKLQVLDEKGQPTEIDPSWADKVDAQLNLAKLGEPSLPEGFLDAMPKGQWNAHTSGAPVSGGTTGGSANPTASSEDSGCSAGLIGQPAAIGMLLAAAGLLAVRRRRD